MDAAALFPVASDRRKLVVRKLRLRKRAHRIAAIGQRGRWCMAWARAAPGGLLLWRALGDGLAARLERGQRDWMLGRNEAGSCRREVWQRTDPLARLERLILDARHPDIGPCARADDVWRLGGLRRRCRPDRGDDVRVRHGRERGLERV